MPGYNNYGNYGNYANYVGQGQNINRFPNIPNNGYGMANNGYGYTNGQQTQQDERFQFVDYVSGRAGADAYQLPNGVIRAILFDNDTNRFFIKGYDNNGRPRVLEDNDFQPHVEPEPVAAQPNIDLSPYATKDDIERMFANATSGYVTRKEFESTLSGLSVGNGGRIVRSNEPNA